MYSYKCVFEFGTFETQGWEPHYVCYDGDGLHAFTSGFWITEELKFTKGSDCKYWIPPSQILYIEKIRKES